MLDGTSVTGMLSSFNSYQFYNS